MLDDARTQAWSATATIERLLAAEVDATESPRLASRQHFACAGEIAEFLHHLAASAHQPRAY